MTILDQQIKELQNKGTYLELIIVLEEAIKNENDPNKKFFLQFQLAEAQFNARKFSIAKKNAEFRKGQKYSFQSLEKMSVAAIVRCQNKSCAFGRTGVEHPAYVHGESHLPYPIEFNGELKESIRERDNRICQLCDKTEEQNGRKLDIHHIDYIKENNSEYNLISLCKSCHMKTNCGKEKREYWKQLFERKVYA